MMGRHQGGTRFSWVILVLGLAGFAGLALAVRSCEFGDGSEQVQDPAPGHRSRAADSGAVEHRVPAVRAPAEGASGGPKERVEGTLGLSVLLAKDRILPGEELSARFRVRNVGDAPIRVPVLDARGVALGFLGGRLKFGADTVSASIETTTAPLVETELPPGGIMEVHVDLARLFSLWKPGQYHVQLAFDRDARTGRGEQAIWSAETEFDVRHPTEEEVQMIVAAIPEDAAWGDYDLDVIKGLGALGDGRALPLLLKLKARAEREAKLDEGVYDYFSVCETLRSIERIRVAGWRKDRNLPALDEYLKLPVDGHPPERSDIQEDARRAVTDILSGR